MDFVGMQGHVNKFLNSPFLPPLSLLLSIQLDARLHRRGEGKKVTIEFPNCIIDHCTANHLACTTVCLPHTEKKRVTHIFFFF